MLKQLLDNVELVPLSTNNPVFQTVYNLDAVPKIIDLYKGPAIAYGGYIEDRLAVVYTYDTDVPCGWEKHPDGSFVHVLEPGKHEQAIRFGVNVLYYALSQRMKAGRPAEDLQ